MNVLKWIGIGAGALIVLVIAALLIIPLFIDLNDYKPQIEQQVSAATGRSFAIGGDIDLSLFPWAGVALSELSLGNPAGFAEKEMVRLSSFEVRVKLLPLLFRDVQVKRFVVQGPRIVLVRQKDGRANWEGFAGGQKAAGGQKQPPSSDPPEAGAPGKLPFEALAVGEFAVTDGTLRYIDRQAGAEHTVSELVLRLTDISLDQPVPLSFSAKLDQKPVSVTGRIGPVGRQPGTGDLPFDLVFAAAEQLSVAVKGKVAEAATRPSVTASVAVSPFSPRKLAAALGGAFPIETADPEALGQVSLKTGLAAGTESVSLKEGVLTIDDTTARFSARVSEFSRPNAAFDVRVDRVDIDRYLPPKKEKTAAPDRKPKTGGEPQPGKADYGPLRKLILDGKVTIGELKAAGAKLNDVRVTVTAKDGVVRVDPLALALYGGTAAGGVALDVRTDRPKTDLRLGMEQVAVNPLLNDLLDKDFLEGATSATIGLSFAGDTADAILGTLSGDGRLSFTDGAIKGVDLADMARNIRSAFGAAEAGAEKPRTDFTELVVPFALKNGVASTPGTVLKSPFLRLKAAGKADLVDKVLDFRLNPKLVGTIKGQGDTETRAGLAVPITVRGALSSPKFAPDLEGAVKQQVESLTSPESIQQLLPSRETEGGGAARPEEQIQDLIKGLPFGGKK